MKTKLTIAALAVASTWAVNVQAATSENSVGVLNAIMGIDVPNENWVNQNVWAGVSRYAEQLTNIDGNRTDFTGSAWVYGDEAAACDTWAGVLCVDGEITYLEIPFAEVNGEMSRLMTALGPVSSTLRSLNVVGNFNLRGSAEGLEELQALEGLYLDNTGLSGELPDLSGLSELRFAGLNDNFGLTGLAGGIGGSNLEVLNLNNTPNFTADLTSVLQTSRNSLIRLNLANSAATGQIPDYSDNPNLSFFVVAGSGLGGSLNLANAGQISPDNLDTSGTGVSAGAGTDGLIIVPSVAAVTNVSAVADGANAMLVSWSAATDVDGYIVAYSNDDGVSWSSEEISDGAADSASINSLAAGTYLVSVTAYATNDDTGAVVQSAATRASDSVVISDADASTAPASGTEDGETTSARSSGGGAALWLGLLPLMGLARKPKV